MTLKIIALCYLRLSNRGEKEVSIAMQRARCQAECDRLGLTPVFYEEGLGKHSANTRKKLPQWDALLERALSDPAVYCVMAYDHERAFRNVAAARSVADKLAACSVKLIFTVSGEVDTRSASGKMIYTIQSAFAEHYSNYVSEKLRDHFETLRADGIYTGHHAPFGLKRIGKAPDVSFEATPELAVILEWFVLYTSETIGTINGSLILNGRGLRWHSRTGIVREILPDDLRHAVKVLESYRPFLPPNLYQAVRRRKSERAMHKRNGKPSPHPTLLLRGLLFCARCGKPYVSATQPDRYGHLHGYYRHRPPVGCGNIVKPSARRIHAMVWAKVAALEWSDELKSEMVRALTSTEDVSAQMDTALTKEKLERRLRNYEQMLADEDITRAVFLKHKADILQELGALPKPASPPRDEPLSEDDARASVEHFTLLLTDPALGTSDAKNQALGAIFQKVSIEGKRGDYSLEFTPQPLFEDVLDVVS